MTKQIIKFPNAGTWEKLLMRWSDFPLCGEKRLVCAVIANAIADDKKDHELQSVALRTRFFQTGLSAYCGAIGLDSEFVRDQVLLVASKVGETVEVTA